MKLYAFISYQTSDKFVAHAIKSLLEPLGIESFLAHEDIHVSEEWRAAILHQLGKAQMCFCLWSKAYLDSAWCIQESGIVSFRGGLTEIPLSLDGTIPHGFAGNIQAKKIDPDDVTLRDLIPGLLKADFEFGIEAIFKMIQDSKSFRVAEANFKILLPYIDGLSREQGKKILEIAIENNQVHHASLCASEYLPPILDQFEEELETSQVEYLRGVFAQYE